MQFLAIIFLLGVSPLLVHGQSLTASTLEEKLPSKLDRAGIHYDGDDFIYFFGGVAGGGPIQTHILRFDISSSKIEQVGNLPFTFLWSALEPSVDGSGTVYLFDGYGFANSKVFSYDPQLNETVELAPLPYDVLVATSVRRDDSTILVFSGQGERDAMFSFDTNTSQITMLENLPAEIFTPSAVRVGNKAYIFGQLALYPESFISVDLGTLESEIDHSSGLPRMQSPITSVYDGQFIYLLGGCWPTDADTHAIMQFNPATYAWTLIPVENMPLPTPDYYSYTPMTIYVEKHNRIYFFGGTSREFETGFVTHHDDIWFVDLDQLVTTSDPGTTTEGTSTTLNPDIFSCANRTNDNYPHPVDCSMYITCLNEELEVHSCPSPLLFDPQIGNCNLPELVDCKLSCSNLPDGQYPHPHECSLFIICLGEKLHVYKCPDDTVFHPDQGKCVPRELYQCNLSDNYFQLK